MIRDSCFVKTLKAVLPVRVGQSLHREPRGREVKPDDFRTAVLMLSRPGREKRLKGFSTPMPRLRFVTRDSCTARAAPRQLVRTAGRLKRNVVSCSTGELLLFDEKGRSRFGGAFSELS